MSFTAPKQRAQKEHHFPPFNLERLFKTVFDPKAGEKVCILIDLENIEDVKDFAFLKQDSLDIQKKAYEIFFQGINDLKKKLNLAACDFYAYERTFGSNLDLPSQAMAPDGKQVNFEKNIYANYDIILCISTDSATAPLTASAKQHGFRGATMHGLNDIILASGLAVDYNEVSHETEKLRQGMTGADSFAIDFEVGGKPYHLEIDVGHQEAQKSHGICHVSPDIANLPAGEVYFVPKNAHGQFPIKFDDETIGLMDVQDGRAIDIKLLSGNQKTIDTIQSKLRLDPSTGILGELGFGTQVLPYSGRDIQDEKIFGTFHLATGRNDHLNGHVLRENFKYPKNATHDDILFSSTKTPEIRVKQVLMNRRGKQEVIIKDYEPSAYLLGLKDRNH